MIVLQCTTKNWQKVMSQVVQVYSFILKLQTHSFVSDAATFVAVHSERILLVSLLYVKQQLT